MEKFVASIRKKYQQNLINRERQWPPCHTEKLIRLVLVESDHKHTRSRDVKCTSIKYEDLFEMKSKNKTGRATKILMEGDAGIGKTTLCIAISEDWANGKLFQQFKLLLLLPLREKVVSSASTLIELLSALHPSKTTCSCIAKCLEEDEGENVLIIADGWDELAISKRQEDSFLYNLLSGKMLPFVSVLLTSRHTASAPLHRDPYFDFFIDVYGFNIDDIEEYIQSEFLSDQVKATRLLEQLDSNPLVKSICSIPLNCAIICHLWRTLEEDLPTTMTNLYNKIILNVLLRNIQKIPAYKSILSLPTFDNLPAALHESWGLLCEFAYQTLAKDQLVFTKEELANFFPQGLSLDENILCFGMLQSTESILDVGRGLTFHFLHLTFQEFLAALYAVRLPKLNRYVTIEITVFWRFFFGISFGNCMIMTDDKRSDLLLVIKQIIDTLSMLIYQHDKRQYLPLLFHCAFEANNDYINTKVVKSIIVSKNRSVVHPSDSYMSLDISTTKCHTAYDCAALIHIIANTNTCGTLEISMIEFNECGIHDKQVIALADALAHKKGKLQVNILSLSKNKLSWQRLGYLFNRASTAFQSLQELELSNIYTEDTKEDQFSNLADALSLLNCPKLQSLELSNNNLGIAGAKAVGRLVSDLTQQPRNFELSLNETKLGDEGIKSFTHNLKGKCRVRCIELQNNGIQADGVICLAEVISSGKLILGEAEFGPPCFGLLEMCGLDLSCNPLGIEGTLAVGRMLNSTGYFFNSLFLTDCKLTVARNLQSCSKDSELNLYEMDKNLTITKLCLDKNSFSGGNSCILASFMFLCPSLKVLQTRYCDITSDDLKHIITRLSELNYVSNLNHWDLIYNKIDDNGVSTLLEHLQSMFPEAEYIRLCVEGQRYTNSECTCTISDEMNKKLQEELTKLKEVREAEMKTFMDSMLQLLALTQREEVISTNHATGDDGGINKSVPANESSEIPESVDNHDQLLPLCSTVAQDSVEQITTSAVSPLHTPGATPIFTCRSTSLAKINQYSCTSSLYDVEIIKDLDQYVLCSTERASNILASTQQTVGECLPQSLFNKVLDCESGGVPKHLGKIADFMNEWKGPVAEGLGLTPAEVAAIQIEHPRKLQIQTRAALHKWQQKQGSKATYGKLIQIFEGAKYKNYADYVKMVYFEKEGTG